MKNYNTFLNEYREPTLFPGIRVKEYETSIKYFIEEHKHEEILDTEEDFDIDEILSKYDFDTVAKDVYENDGNSDIFIEYLEAEEFDIEIIKEFIDVHKQDYDKEDLEELFENEYVNGDDLFSLMDEPRDFEEWYVESKYIDWTIFYENMYYNILVGIIEDSKKTGEVPIFRSILINKDDDKHKEYSGVGVYWSYAFEGAEPHGASGKNNEHEIILKGLVDFRNIDWYATFFKSVYNLSDEQEIETKEYATVKLIGYVLVDAMEKYIDIKDKHDKEFLMKQTKKKNHEIISDFKEKAKEKYDIDLDEYVDILV